MNFMQAVHTERPFKRPGWVEWLAWDSYGIAVHAISGKEAAMIRDDIVAGDWQVQETLDFELRLKELQAENLALKAQLASLSKENEG